MNLTALRSALAGIERRWIGLGLTYLAAWWFPLSFLWQLLHPGKRKPEGIDGPLSWLWKSYWGVTWSPFSYQMLIPFGVAILIWSRREEAAATRTKPDRRSPYLLAAGCLGLIVSQFIHLSLLATAALIAIAAGVVVQVYGLKMLRALRVPFLYWLLMVPPPESVAGNAMKLVGALTGRVAALSLKLLGKGVLSQPPQLILGSSIVEVGGIGTESASGIASMTGVVPPLLCWALYRRWTPSRTLMALALGFFLAMLLNVLRVDAALLLQGSSKNLSDFVLQFNAWFFSLIASALTLWLDARAGKLAATGSGWLGKALGKGWQVSGKGADRVMDRSGKVARGTATGVGRAINLITAPFVFMLTLLLNAVGKAFALLGRSNSALQQRFDASDRARRSRNQKKRGRR